jgi:hypothetical protein
MSPPRRRGTGRSAGDADRPPDDVVPDAGEPIEATPEGDGASGPGKAPGPGKRASRASRPRKRPADAVDAPAPAAKTTTPGPQKRTTPQDRPHEEPKASGYRTSKRSSRSGRQMRRQAKAERVRTEVTEVTSEAVRTAVSVAKTVAVTVLSIAVVAAALWGGALGVNAIARWNARRTAAANAAKSRAELAKENLLVIAVRDKEAVGFIALKAERVGNRVLGIAIPEGAFVEVPGQGFESIGDSYHGGAGLSKDAVSNFLGVPFERYVAVDQDTYQRLLTKQDIGSLLDRPLSSDLKAGERTGLQEFMDKVSAKDVWIVPMPVKPVALGTERYYEPQRAEIADLILQWWGVHAAGQKQAVRLIIYNGVGTPGVAGAAARQLIRAGFRVVDSKNADRFDYETTRILLYHGTKADADRVRETLGTGEIAVESAAQNVADIIVVIGADYAPSAPQ